MGADLIAYIIKTPRKITRSQRNAAITDFNTRREHLFKDYPTQKSIEAADVRSVIKTHPWLEDIIEDQFDEIGEAYDWVRTSDPVKVVDDFIAISNGSARDSCSRIDPDNKKRAILCAGEMSWGDEPEGYGYQSIKGMMKLGIAKILGVT